MDSLIPITLAIILGGFVLCTLGPRESACYTEDQIGRAVKYRQVKSSHGQGHQMMYLDEAERADATMRALLREGGDTICSEQPTPPSPGKPAQRASSR